TNEDGSQVIVFNGEIYNYRELRRELVRRRHRFRTHSDTETIVHLYEEHGPHAVERLRGMFAFAIWDGAARSLFLARDRFGIKPLYYVVAPWGIAFASELKALVAAGLTARELDWDALDAYVQLGYIPAPATPFHDVRKLEPGHWLLWRESVEPIVRALDEPHADDSAVPTWALSQAVGSSYKVALTGIGGDELFAGYWRHLGLLAMEQFGRLPRALRGAAASLSSFLPD